MAEHIVSKEHMESLKALADLNMKVSEARELLSSLQETETEYLVARESTAIERIRKTVSESGDLLAEVRNNYREVENFYKTVSSFSEQMKETHTAFSSLLGDFKMSQVEWDRHIETQEEEISTLRRDIGVEKVRITNEKKNIESARKKLEDECKKIADQRGTLERAIKRLKDNRI